MQIIKTTVYTYTMWLRKINCPIFQYGVETVPESAGLDIDLAVPWEGCMGGVAGISEGLLSLPLTALWVMFLTNTFLFSVMHKHTNRGQ